jgi:hypothetical protein
MKLFLCSALLLASCAPSALAAPSEAAAKVFNLPSEARGQMLPGAKSHSWARVPVGEGGAFALAHLWSVERGAGEAKRSMYSLDLFNAGATEGEWKPATSAVFWSSGGWSVYSNDYGSAPVDITARWLRPKRKEGVVIVLETGDPGAYNHYKVVTFPRGLKSGADNSPRFLTFRRGGYGGGSYSRVNIGVDARGYTTFETEVIPKVAAPFRYDVIIAGWTGRGFAEQRKYRWMPRRGS